MAFKTIATLAGRLTANVQDAVFPQMTGQEKSCRISGGKHVAFFINRGVSVI